MSENKPKFTAQGIAATLATPLFLGMAPIFGKLAIAHADPFTVSALRTVVAVGILWIAYGLFFRRYIFIYPAGLLGCVVIGVINGIGSLFYYSGLHYLDASLVQLINGSYLAFAILLSRIGGQKADARTLIRVSLTIIALIMITGMSAERVDWTGIGLMLGNALMFAGTVILSQYVLYEMPAATAALYVLTTMGVVVTMVWAAVAPVITVEVFQNSILWITILGLTTALSRLAMFASVKLLGGMQTAINAAAEIAVALLLALTFLGDTLSPGQWAGTALLLTSILLIRQKDLLPRGFNPNALIVANMASVQFQRIAFHRAFGTQEHDNEEGIMGLITTQEMIAIQRMMGAEMGGIDPFPIGKSRHIIGDFDEANALITTQPASAPKDFYVQTRPILDSETDAILNRRKNALVDDTDLPDDE
jgi:drug/metabolite transporter (DMT)-like permease